ncbi:MAG TPA: ABC transporter substrate-binding protein [Ilumatobacteraceae bacterium]|nr:ABC transporter substrate-binding protein [Ilumatobacteraceae bacterium]
MRRSTALRRIIPAIAVGALVLAACGSDDDTSDESTDETLAPTDTSADTAGTDGGAGAVDCAATIDDGVLTIATGEPAFYPWVIDNAPETGEGFEAAVAYAVAAEMGYEGDAVVWTRTTFDEAIQPGAKSFDMNLQQYSITEERRENIDFSLPYFTSNQAIVALEGSPAEGATTIADLKGVKFGAQVGTTSLQFITDVIQPDQEPFVYDDNVGAKAALEANQIDAAVFDLPTALFVSGVEIEGSAVVGQFPADAGGTTDQFGFVLEKDSPLTSCVDEAITTLTDNGELAAITQEWLSDFTEAPVITVE